MAKLENKTNKVAVVISFVDRSITWLKEKCVDLRETFNENFTNYAYIIHDKDTIVNEDGSFVNKTLHLHFIGISTTKRLLTFLNQFANWFECSTLAVSIEKMQDLTGAFQYLIHKNDLDKYQYPIEEVITNFNDGEVQGLLNADLSDNLTIDRLIYIIGTSSNAVEVAQRIGLSYFQHYLRVIEHLIDSGYSYGYLRLSKKDLLKY